MDRTGFRKRYREIALVAFTPAALNGYGPTGGSGESSAGLGSTRHASVCRTYAAGDAEAYPGTARNHVHQVGQLLSTRPDLVPHDYVAELSKLQDQAPEVAYVEIAAIVEREFGRPPEQVFGSFNEAPQAAASVAQVHKRGASDGTPVVVKVRRPGIEQQV